MTSTYQIPDNALLELQRPEALISKLKKKKESSNTRRIAHTWGEGNNNGF